MTSAIIYGDISPNVVDGSSIWLMSISEVLSRVVDEVHVQLKMRAETDILLSALAPLHNVTIHQPDSALEPEDAARAVKELAESLHPDLIVVRGFAANTAMAQHPEIAQRLWAYITDLPFPLDRATPSTVRTLNSIAASSARMLSQTQSSRSYLEAIAPHSAGKTVLMSPMIPDTAFAPTTAVLPTDLGTPNNPLSIVYAGKLAADWKTLEMLDLPQQLHRLGITAALTVVGAKFNRKADDPTWVPRMQDALHAANSDPDSGVTWLGSLTREESLSHIRAAHVGLGWRTTHLDSSLEISTKALEYGACDTVPIINRTADHADLYGDDYPGFVLADASSADLATVIADVLPHLGTAQRAARAVSEHYSMDAAAHRMQAALHSALPCITASRGSATQTPPTRICIASHDFKFVGELSAALRSHPGVTLSTDPWRSLHAHDAAHSRAAAAAADTILCEFAGPNLVWHAANRPANTRLVTRLHGFELGGPWLRDFDWETVDAVIVVSEHYRELLSSTFDVDRSRIHVIPNMIDLADFDRPKTEEARFTVGLVGMVPFLKRPDRALDTIAHLRSIDPRFILRIKSRLPWAYPYVWDDPLQRTRYLDLFERISTDPDLRDAVVFDEFSPDIASWLRGVGHILSPSDIESFHLAPAEGMASRALPYVWERDGSARIFGKDTLVAGARDAAEKIVSAASDPVSFRIRGEAARCTAQERWSAGTVIPAWLSALHAPQLGKD